MNIKKFCISIFLIILIFFSFTNKVNANFFTDDEDSETIEDIIDKFPFECSGGQQQRVAIARALITNPKILFADEPTGNIDSLSARELMELFVKINQENNTTIIMVSHDSFVASYSNKLYYIVDGKIKNLLNKNNLSQFDYYSEIVKITTQIDFR